MVIRLDAKPTSAATTPAAAPQQKYPAATVQVRESRDHVPVTVAKTTHSASAVIGLSTSAVEESSGSSMLPRITVSAERSKDAHQQQPAASGPLTSTPIAPTVKRQRFVKKAAGPRDVELKHASPSSSLSSGSSGRSTSRDNVSLERTVVQSLWKEDQSSATVLASTTAKDPGHSAVRSDAGSDSDVVQSTAASTNVGRSVANRIAQFEQLPSSSDSSLDALSTDLTSTSAGTGPAMRPSSEYSQQAASIPAKGPKRRAPLVNPGPIRFKLNTSTDDITSASAKSAVSSASGSAGVADGQSGQDEQVTVMKDEDRIVDSTRL